MKRKREFVLFGISFNQKSIVRWKIYFDRARMYIGYFNFVMISFVFLNSFHDPEIRNMLDKYQFIFYPVIMLLFIFISLFLGKLDTKLGMRKEEYRNQSIENPIMMEILNSLNELKETQKIIIDKKN